jgi:hypothetical protein
MHSLSFTCFMYIDINEDNVANIVEESLTQIFPPPDVDWLWAQRARHWINAKRRNDADVHFAGDLGREFFSPTDDEGCNGWKTEDSAFCETDMERRKFCPVTCDLYLDEDFYGDESRFSAEPWLQ